jgi:hypothetical protein
LNRADLMSRLEDRNMEEVIELIEDAENGKLEELELAPSLGLLREEDLNREVLQYLEEQGVTIIYVNEEDE